MPKGKLEKPCYHCGDGEPLCEPMQLVVDEMRADIIEDKKHDEGI